MHTQSALFYIIIGVGQCILASAIIGLVSGDKETTVKTLIWMNVLTFPMYVIWWKLDQIFHLLKQQRAEAEDKKAP